MNQFSGFLHALDRFKFEHQHWPMVKISPSFWHQHMDELMRLNRDGIEIEVAVALSGKFSFVLCRSARKGVTSTDPPVFKKVIDWLDTQNRGNVPVYHLPTGHLSVSLN